MKRVVTKHRKDLRMSKPIMYCTLDTETLGGAAKPEGIYNAGGTIHDRNGFIHAGFNLLIAEHFKEILDRAYYGKKNFDRYQQMIDCGIATMVPTEKQAIDLIDSLLTEYNVRYVMAFNTCFDLVKTACSSLITNREFIDIYEMAYTILRNRPSYKKYCNENGLMTKNGNPLCRVETIYGFLTNNPDFKEEHTAFSDARQEMEIFVKCVRAHQKYAKNFHCGERFGWV